MALPGEAESATKIKYVYTLPNVRSCGNLGQCIYYATDGIKFLCELGRDIWICEMGTDAELNEK